MNSNEMIMLYVLTPLVLGMLGGVIIKREFQFLNVIQKGAFLAIIGKSMLQMKASQGISLIIAAVGIFILGFGISLAIRYTINNKANADGADLKLNDKNRISQDLDDDKSAASKNRHVSVLDRYK